MPRIQILPPTLVNRIAAGECVERPASVVKELVENAIDAGGRRIGVTVVDGGRELIQVGDDGCGMDADDLRLAVHPHATSKLLTDDDLFNIRTMGFRGEALASIGAVARLQITSRPGEHEVGHFVRVEGGEIGGPSPCTAPPGTTVEVRDLFYAVPARRKFLRTSQTEMGHVSEQFARLALAHPSIAFSLRHGGRLFHDLPPAEGRRKRIGDFYGVELAEVLLEVRRESHDVLVEGYVAPPREARGSNKWEYVFVNGRYVRDRFISHAVKEAYRSLIDPSRYPVVFLFVSVDPGSVDVNVHPTKVEVRWRDSNFVHSQVLAALRDRFLASNLDHRLKTATPPGEEYRDRVRQAMVDFFTTARPVDPAPRGGPSSWEHAPRQADAATAHEARTPFSAAPAVAFERAPGAAGRTPVVDGPAAEAPAVAPTAGSVLAPRRAAVQVHNMYIVAETEDGLLILDQHALHERILYEEFRARIADRPLEAQRLLLPDVVRVAPDRIAALEQHADLLARLGIELTQSGPQTVTLHAFPSFLERANRTEFVRELLDILAEPGARPSTETLLHDVLDMMACKAAVKFGDPLTGEEIEALLARRQTAERSSHCPHGRPTTLHLTLRDLERQFKRR